MYGFQNSKKQTNWCYKGNTKPSSSYSYQPSSSSVLINSIEFSHIKMGILLKSQPPVRSNWALNLRNPAIIRLNVSTHCHRFYAMSCDMMAFLHVLRLNREFDVLNINIMINISLLKTICQRIFTQQIDSENKSHGQLKTIWNIFSLLR